MMKSREVHAFMNNLGLVMYILNPNKKMQVIKTYIFCILNYFTPFKITSS